MTRLLVEFVALLDHAPLPRPALVSGRQGQQYYKGGPAYQRYKQTIREACADRLPDEHLPYDGPTEIRIVVQFDEALRPKNRANETWHLKPPDTDNLLKPIQDALTGLMFTDDRTVVVQRIAKCWGQGNEVIVQLWAHDPKAEVPLTDKQLVFRAAGIPLAWIMESHDDREEEEEE